MAKKVMTQQAVDRAVQRQLDDDARQPAGETRRVTAVLALNAVDFQQWCTERGKNARDRNLLMVTPGTTRGLKDAHLEITARGMWRSDIHLLMQGLVPALDGPSQKRVASMGWGQPIP
ncbi:MAG: hypothetical protein M0R73_09155 [Dehalococcoidia bacterium]|nr:hypothetical protein [Dehalococcoidia bacterium]